MPMGKLPPWSEAKMRKASPICFNRQLQLILFDFALASARAQAARAVNTTTTAMIATNSIRVTPESRPPGWNEVIVNDANAYETEGNEDREAVREQERTEATEKR